MSKLYILLRKDLGRQYGAVQAGHAVAEFLLNHPTTTWRNGTLVYLSVPDEPALIRWKDQLDRRGIETSLFREPDLDDAFTALAAVDEGKIFSSLPLAS